MDPIDRQKQKTTDNQQYKQQQQKHQQQQHQHHHHHHHQQQQLYHHRSHIDNNCSQTTDAEASKMLEAALLQMDGIIMGEYAHCIKEMQQQQQQRPRD